MQPQVARGAREELGRAARRAARRTAAAARRPLASRRPLPDFIVIGAQRSGTTSLLRHLEAHPDVGGPLLGMKGVHYFDNAYARGERWYRAHFPTEAQRQRHRERTGAPLVVGEASPYYLFHPLVAERLGRDVPHAKLIALLRDPVERAHSHYHHMRWEGLEDAPTFEEALAREPERLAEDRRRLEVDPGAPLPHHEHHAYVARGHYADQLDRLHRHVPAEQILVLVAEDLFADPDAHVRAVCRFLGLDADRLLGAEPFVRRNGTPHAAMLSVTRDRLTDTFATSNTRLAALLDRELPWLGSPRRTG